MLVAKDSLAVGASSNARGVRFRNLAFRCGASSAAITGISVLDYQAAKDFGSVATTSPARCRRCRLELRDVVCPGEEWSATLTGVDPFAATCTLTDADTGVVVDHSQPHRRNGQVQVIAAVDRPGLYRVRIDGASTPVVQFVLAAP